MAWKILEGIDRSGKSSVAEYYKSQGFEVVHFSAPSKKYSEEGYTGPSYLDDVIDILIANDGKDVIWDRSWFGELIWPHVYGRKPQLSEEDFEVIQEFEDRNSTERILMIDTDQKAHWKRCVDNKEPLNQPQFTLAGRLYNNLAHKHNFVPRELKDFQHVKIKAEAAKPANPANKQEELNKTGQSQADDLSIDVRSSNKASAEAKAVGGSEVRAPKILSEVEKLETANAINEVLSSRLIKKNGAAFEKIESDIKDYLRNQLSNIFNGGINTASLSTDEITILKVFCQRLREKEQAAQPTKPVRK